MTERTISPRWILIGIWLVSNLGDRLWLALNQSVPAWDQSNHLSFSLLYLRALQQPNLWNGDWWRQLWMLSPKYPPITYLLSVPFQAIWGVGNDQALLTGWLYSAVLILLVYTLAKHFFNPEVGIWAAVITVLLPRLYQTRLQFLLDTPLLIFTLATFTCLTLWKDQGDRRRQWIWAVILGLCLGLGLLTKQSILFYLIFPLLVLEGYFLWRRQWERLLQLAASFLLSGFFWFPWYRTNWIYLFSTATNSNAIPAALEGDPQVNTWAAWVYYWNDLPLAVSWVWLIVPLVGLALHCLGRFPRSKDGLTTSRVRPGLLWLGSYLGATYFFCSALYNKDSRYIMPYLPILAIILAYGLTRWRGRWHWVRWITLTVSVGAMITNLFPIPGSDVLSQALNPAVLFRPYLGPTIPTTALVKTAIATTPYQVVNLGVIPNTSEINPNTLNYFGKLEGFQAYGRELSNSAEIIQQDLQNFDWFVSQTGDNGFTREHQLALGKSLATNPQFQRLKDWTLANGDLLSLYHRQNPGIQIKPLATTTPGITLEKISLPARVPPGHAVPITYQWSGSWQKMNQGLVLLTWHLRDHPETAWLHDHAIGFGSLAPAPSLDQGLQVLEQTAMLPSADLAEGTYQLEASYLDLATGKSTTLTIPETTISLDRNAPILQAPPLDFVTQLRQLAQNLPRGRAGLDPIFRQVDRLNLYDPSHDYLRQVDASLAYRLAHQPSNPLPLTYALVLARVLQENPQTAIAALKELVTLDAQNPYAHAYLAFVYLYDWQGHNAEQALTPGLELAPDNLELNALLGIAKIMQGNLWGGWQTLEPLLKK